MTAESVFSVATVTGVVLPLLGVMATIVAVTGAVFWYTRPGATLHFLQNVFMYVIGLRIHKVRVGDLKVCYAERGRLKPTIFFIHGFTATKEMWLPIIPFVPRDQHIIALDLPGHGDTDEPPENFDVHTTGMAHFVHQFVEAIGLNKQPFHLIGISLGGAIAGLYSAFYPRDVALLTSVCPAMLTPVETEFMAEVRAGRCCLLPDTPEGIRNMFEACLFHKNKAPRNKQVLKALLEMRKPNEKFFWRCFEVITASMDEKSNELMQHLAEIEAPTQVIWGCHDDLVHVSGAEVLQERLRRCVRVDILERCGHVIMVDRPRAFVKLLLDFHKHS